MKTIALWLEFRFNLFLVPFEGFGNTKLSLCHLRTSFNEIPPSPVTGESPSKRPVTRSFDVFFDLRLNKQLSKQWRRRWFETPLRLLWRHCNVNSTPCSRALPIGLKMRNISRPWPNISSSEGSQDTSACQISTVLRSPSNTETTHLKCFIESKCNQKLVKSADRDQNIIRWSGYSSIWYFRPFPHAFSRKYPKTLNLTRFTRFFEPVWPRNLPYDLGNLGATSTRCF